MNKTWAIAKNTFLQTLRQPIYSVMIALTMIVLVLSVPLSGWTMGIGASYQTTDQNMLVSAGLATMLAMGLLTASLSASAGISKEIDDKTVLTVVSKPVNRATFILGKFLGLALAMTLAYYLNSTVFLLTVRHKVVSAASTPINWPVLVFGMSAVAATLVTAGVGNFLFSWYFGPTSILSGAIFLTAAVVASFFVGVQWRLTPLAETFSIGELPPELFLSLLLTLLAVLLMTSVALVASTRLGQILALLGCVVVLFAGAQVPYLSETLNRAAPGSGFLTAALPNLTYFFALDTLAMGQSTPATLVLWKLGYFACYTSAMLVLAVALFQTRSLESTTPSASLPGAVALITGIGRIAAWVGGLIAVVQLTQANTYTLAGMMAWAILVVLSFGVYLLSKAFGAGKRWAWWTLLLLSGAVLVHGWVAWAGARSADLRLVPVSWSTITLSVLLSAAVVLGLLLPKTRHHLLGEKG